MSLALMQAQKVLGNTKKNPAVGCVIVKNNNLISAGHTSFNGSPHAEHNAIKFSNKKNYNSDLYVTLEPCSHYGKTSPCTKKIIKNKINKVFFSLKDPDIRSHDKSTKEFRRNMVAVKKGILYLKVKNFYESYLNSKNNKLPFVTAKIAISKDYFTKNKKGKWITNQFSRGRVHLMRSNHDCILTTVSTVIMDNPKMTCRIYGLENTSPARIILDKALEIPINSKILKDGKKYNTIIIFNHVNVKKIKKLKKLNIKLIKMPLNKNGYFNLEDILIRVKNLNFSRIFIEAGLNLISNFLDQNLINHIHIFQSNKILGNNGSNSFKKIMRLFSKKKIIFNNNVNLFGDKLMFCRVK